jgi:small subunit ribosomal protein S16
MLVIRMQRTGRKGHAQFRVVVQDSRRTPTSGKIVASLGSFNPHNKQAVLDKDKISFYLDHGAQPSDRVARLLKSEGIKLPGWVKLESDKTRSIRNPEKLRKNRPDEPVETKAEPEVTEESADKAPAETTTENTTNETPEEISESSEEDAAPAEEPTETPQADEEAVSEAETTAEEKTEA